MSLQQMPFPIDLEKIGFPSIYQTDLGAAFLGDSLKLLNQLPDHSINLVLTSPPFALQREKEYGNKQQSEYIEWLAQFAEVVYRKLKDDGSFVLDLGGAYEKGKPVRSLYNFRIPIHFCDEIGFFLAEDCYWFNPSKLPSPIEWVNKRKIRAKDSVNTVWWFSKSEFPKSDVSKVLTEYSSRMKKLLEDPDKFYDPKKRPSGHDISKGFSKDNGGAIPSNLLQIPNTDSNSQYLRGCKILCLKAHPARFPSKLPEFFIRFLTDPGDLVVDIFAGSNTTGFVAEQECRYWLAFENELQYLAASSLRFMPEDADDDNLSLAYQTLMSGSSVEIIPDRRQLKLFEQKAQYQV
jgi:DNA modification methylase